MESENTYNVIVLGLGAMGSATVYQLAKRNCKVLGIDQFAPPHNFGSTHGDTRITRQAIGEGEQYTPLSLRSYEIWDELEKQSGEKLLEKCGGLIISSGAKTAVNHVPEFFENTVASAKKHAIKHDILDASQIRERFPQFKVQDNEIGYYEYEAGFLYPEKCVQVQIDLAEKNGASIHKNEKVESFEEQDGLVTVKTNIGEYKAKKLIITAGAWFSEMMNEKYSKFFKVSRQVLYWFDTVKEIEYFSPKNFPIFIWELQGNKQGIYGFPAIDGQHGGIKIATEQYDNTTTPETINRAVSEEETQTMFENYVAPYFPDLNSKCIKSATCLYTVTPDSHFVIDNHPEHKSIIVASPCSGHGFKHSAAIGEVLAQMAIDGKSEIDISSFSLKRFGV